MRSCPKKRAFWQDLPQSRDQIAVLQSSHFMHKAGCLSSSCTQRCFAAARSSHSPPGLRGTMSSRIGRGARLVVFAQQTGGIVLCVFKGLFSHHVHRPMDQNVNSQCSDRKGSALATISHLWLSVSLGSQQDQETDFTTVFGKPMSGGEAFRRVRCSDWAAPGPRRALL